jgi:alcohol dehydrogenase
MRGLVLADVGRITWHDDLPDAVVEAPTDAVVAVRRAGLCGSDLHPWAGRERVRLGVVPGHEAVGEVVAVGSAVTAVEPGARVLVPFTTSCGACRRCRRGLTARCARGQLFGFGPADASGPVLHGAQAALLRVPLADTTLVPVPADVDDVRAVLLADNVPTAWEAAERAGVQPGATVAVVGLGAVGLAAVAAARRQGAAAVVAVDPVADRRDRAAALGATAVHPDDAAAAVAAHSEDDGAAGVVEAAGTEAAQAGAFALLRPGATLSVIAMHTGGRFAFTPVAAYDVNVTVRTGRASVRATLGRALPHLRGVADEVAEVVATHPVVPLRDGAATYARFAAREAGFVKAMFVP